MKAPRITLSLAVMTCLVAMSAVSISALAATPTPTETASNAPPSCPPGSGYYSNGSVPLSGAAPKSGACIPCPAGTSSNSSGRPTPNSGACLPCPPGTYSKISGSKSCLACPPGTYSNGNGSATCIPCPSGAYSKSDGSVKCTPCPPGSTTRGPGQTSCSATTSALTPTPAPTKYSAGRYRPFGKVADDGMLQALSFAMPAEHSPQTG